MVISPGPGHPLTDSGISIDVIKKFAGVVPVLGIPFSNVVAIHYINKLLGVCLGHQAIVAMNGGKVVVTGEIKHGKTSLVIHDGKGMLFGIPSPFPAIRYHSLAGNYFILFSFWSSFNLKLCFR